MLVAIPLGSRGPGTVREVAGGFLVFPLLLCQEAGEGYNVGVDFL